MEPYLSMFPPEVGGDGGWGAVMGVGGGVGYPWELDHFENFISNSLSTSSNFVSKSCGFTVKIAWLGFRFFTYFPEEFLAHVI